MLPGKKFTVDDVLQIVRRRIWFLIVPPAVGLFVSLLVSASLPNLYQSDTLIAIVPQRVPDSFVQSTVTLRTEERLDAISTQVQSRTLLEQLVQEFDLYPAERRRLPMEDVVELVRTNIDVEPEAPRRGPRGPEPLHAFHVRFTYSDPEVSARVTQRLGSMFVDQNARDRGALADATSQFLETQLATARELLEATERRLETFREIHGGELPTQLQSNMTAIQSLNMQTQAIVESTARDRDRKLMLERLHNDALAEPAVAPPAPPPSFAQNDPAAAAGGTLEEQLTAARAGLARLQLRLTTDHPDIGIARRLIRDIEAQIEARPAADDGTPPAPVTVTAEEQRRREQLRTQRAEIESLERQITFKESEELRLRAAIAEYQRRIEAVPGVESEWVALTRDYDTQQDAYKELLTKSEDARVAVDLEKRQIGEQFRILDGARVPTRPISPMRLQINAIGLAIGLMLGLGVGALLELKDASFRSEMDVVGVLSLPVLAIVPFVETAAERTRRVRRVGLVAATGVAAFGAATYVFWAMRLWNFVV